MKSISSQLSTIVTRVIAILEKEDTRSWDRPRAPGKWSKKQILGHLCDSAMNNIHRFVRGTYDRDFKVVYFQDEWVAAERYQVTPPGDLITLWTLLNKQIVRILDAYPEERKQVRCDVGKENVQFATMEFLASEYIVHLEHHLAQIFESSHASPR